MVFIVAFTASNCHSCFLVNHGTPSFWRSTKAAAGGKRHKKKAKKSVVTGRERHPMAIHQLVPFLDEVFVDYPAVAGSGPMASKKHTGVLAVAEEQAAEELAKKHCCGPTNTSCCGSYEEVRTLLY